MVSLVSNTVPLVLGVLLGSTGAVKLFGRQAARQAANTALVRILNDGRRATLALRAVGAVELLVAAGLLAVPTAMASGTAAALLGAGFVGYLGYSKVTAPDASCGCTAKSTTPITWRAFARAGLVMAGGALAVAADTAWWPQSAHHPLSTAAVVLVSAALLMALTTDLDHLWLVPLRKFRLRVFGNPLGGTGEQVPVVASVELLENSLAWQASNQIVRSGLLDHWDEDGWRFLRYAGVYEGSRGTRPVSVVFALDIEASLDTTSTPAVRVTVVDDHTEEVVTADLLSESPLRHVLPVVG
jgi:hypothetical protein